ncbi:MAG: hypothetical protein C4524_09200 [Candidatus Zixiibacteriota bacterium]|nr:MAG: hypothetical protein C4524_09200 [candidate division Zixibacteria bacterium]
MMRSRSLSLLLAAAALLMAASGAGARIQIPFTLKVGYTSSYDDNILKYSARDLGRFETNTEPAPSEVNTTDDWINTFSVRLYQDFSLSRQFKFRPYYSGRISVFAINSIKNTTSHYVSARLSWRYRLYLTAKYFYLPSYYLRLYRDRDLGTYQGAEFDLTRPAASLRFRLPPYEVEAEYGREFVYYNNYFTEYDAEADFYGVTVAYTGFPRLDASLEYNFKVSDNIGFRQSSTVYLSAAGEDSEYGDGSYEEDRYALNLQYRLPLDSEWDWSVVLGLQRSLRYYQSEQSLVEDPFHAGRRDRRDILETAVILSPYYELEFEARFIYDLRRTDSPDPNVSAIKDFDDRTIEFTLTYQVF